MALVMNLLTSRMAINFNRSGMYLVVGGQYFSW